MLGVKINKAATVFCATGIAIVTNSATCEIPEVLEGASHMKNRIQRCYATANRANQRVVESRAIAPRIQSRQSRDVEGDSPPVALVANINEHVKFIHEVSSGPQALISNAMATLSLRVWSKVQIGIGRPLPVPVACAGPDGRLLYTWDKAGHHLELEFIPDSPIEIYYRNRTTGESWGEEYDSASFGASSLSSDAIDRIKLFA